ncbi:MAG TPA: Trm112 family protein [Pirellulales bacterium]|nr:Trm112 family protein [Pirellulales bacterium]
MIGKELLDILVCPQDRTSLELADPDLVAKLNRSIAAGVLMNMAGEKVEQPLDGGLVREDGTLLYPIVDGIPVMLVDEAIRLPKDASG